MKSNIIAVLIKHLPLIAHLGHDPVDNTSNLSVHYTCAQNYTIFICTFLPTIYVNILDIVPSHNPIHIHISTYVTLVGKNS